MDDLLTKLVLDYQSGQAPLQEVRNLILLEAFAHLRRYQRKGEDEVSEFLLEFHGRIEGILGRFQCRGLPFRHFLLRTLRWQWNTFRAGRSRARRQRWVVADVGLGSRDEEVLAEPGSELWVRYPGVLSNTSKKRVLLLALKAAPYLGEQQLEAVSRYTGAELAWLQACQHRLKLTTDGRRCKRALLIEKRGEAFCRRLMAEDEVRQEADPDRRLVYERRAILYRTRLASLARQQLVMKTAPTHQELAQLLGMPKGSVDSSLHHLKKELVRVYSGGHDDPIGDQQRTQKTRI